MFGMNLNFILATLAVSVAVSVAKEAAERPPLPKITSIKVEPSSLTLTHARDVRRVLVWGLTEEGTKFDLSDRAQIESSSSFIEVGADGYIHPKSAGEAEIAISALDHQFTLPVKVKSAEALPVRFVRDVVPVMSRIGCNAGTCHGSANGKNGFKMSLRGYDPEFDYQALINDISGRRFNRVAVDESLMLQKPSGEVPHEGGVVLKKSSPDYQLIREWILQGTKPEDVAEARAHKIEVLPTEIDLDLPGRSQRVIVLAHYKDGSTREVTRDAALSSSSDEIATVKNGVVTAVRRGEAAILIRYEGNYATQELRVMGDRSGYRWVDVPENNHIDRHVNAKLRKMKILPSDLCSDAEFIRRVSLDLTGLPPSSSRVREFLADQRADKREKAIDELLASNEYTEFWANKWADLLQSSSENLGVKSVWQYRSWIRKAIAENKPYDQFVREVLLAEGSAYENPAANYYRVLREPGKIAEDVSQTFLGVRFNCNKCHDHPFERWTQNQYYEFAAYFSRVAFKKGPLGSNVIKFDAGGTQHVHAEEVLYHNAAAEVSHPRNGKTIHPKVPFGHPAEPIEDEDRRKAFVNWLASKENPLFAKAMANRVWSYFFGIGIIEPVDDIRAGNPPTNPALLEALTSEFIASNFDLRKLMRTICTSRTYQLSFVPNKWNADDTVNFSHARPRRLSAEQLYDAVSFVTGAKRQFSGLPKGMRAVEVPDGKIPGDDFLSLFGRPKRQSACECERSSNLTLSHAMSLINGAAIGEAVSAPDNGIQKLVDSEKDDRKVLEELYFAILNRAPSDQELKQTDFSQAPSRLEAAQDLAWALLNSPAFLFNR